MGSFFIRRPIVAMVIAIVTVIVGLVALTRLPVAQYPDITPPVIQVTTTYVGASALDVEQSVATPIEQQVNGVERSIYLKSTNANDGTLKLEVSFEVGANLDISNVLTQNRVSQATPSLPTDVKNYGVSVKKSLSFPLLLVTLTSPSGAYDSNFLSNYALINIDDRLARIEGVGQVGLFGGSDYAMRIWVRPDRLEALGLTVIDLVNAVKAQNVLQPSGQIGGPPAPRGTEFTYVVRTQGRLLSPEEFAHIIVRANPDGSAVRLGDVARLELGSVLYNAVGRLNGKSAAVIAIYQTPGSNALEVRRAVEKTMDEVAARFPPGIKQEMTLDTTAAITAGIAEIVSTLFEAVVLVILVVFVFLQSWRATLIPLLTVPVSLVGTFMVFPLLGFSVNTLSLLGLVLAIGIVVDDAIVVVEAVMHHIELGESPKEATAAALRQVSGPVVAIALVLSAVFIPVAFISGISGRLYQQFAITIAVSVLFSAINALTLSPALASLLLRPRGGKRSPLRPFYDRFNGIFGRFTDGYLSFTGILVRKAFRSSLIVVLVAAAAVLVAREIPGGFLPDEDNGYFFANVQLPDAASLERTDAVAKKVEAIIGSTPGVEHVTTITGYSLVSGAYASNTAFLFVSLRPWEERKAKERAAAIIASLNRKLAADVPEAVAVSFGPPPIVGLGSGSGYTLMLQDRSGGTPRFLAENAEMFLAAVRKRPEIGSARTVYRAGVPQIFADIDRDKVTKLGVPVTDVNTTLGALLGGTYVNDFNRFGRTYKVYLQAEPEYRADVRSFGLFGVRTAQGSTVPLDTLVTTRDSAGPEFTNRFNLYRAAEITGQPAPGYSSSQALAALEETAKQVLPPGMGYEWSNVSYQEKKAEGTAGVVFAFALVLVFLVLAAQYESWSLPMSVLLGTPFAAFGAFLGLFLARLVSPAYVLNVFAQIGLVMLVGLAAKNAILIVEFAKESNERGGLDYAEAAMAAAKLRLRPILMTAFAFILGVVPLVRAAGTGAEGRKVMGMAVFAGMLVATLLGVVLVPVLFVVVSRLSGGRRPPKGPTGKEEPELREAASGGHP
jgi:hydrophobe/amphiphile efflux-1 (HAE1) family protein